ncbi:cellulase family glycosylhydrolase [Microbulbifer elongatus]|uniref:cellulase family glycosylhydrolase n=1 Tax=Microbulbifer elongatus TaxID=86173 RepID=UPI001E5A9786|nr:cellulase family glycosylhydrolase [Microbulbifer elongatus]
MKFVTKLIATCILLILFGCGSSGDDSHSTISDSDVGSNPPPTTPGSEDDEPQRVAQGFITYQGERLYLNGFNIAWFDFANDVGSGLAEPELRKALQDVVDAGGNTLRWWMHTDGAYTPAWENVDGVRLVSGPGGTFIEDLARALDIAAEYGVYIVPSLWSFDMLRANSYRNPPTADNYRLLTEDAVLQSYLDQALSPMVQALNGHPQLVAWELFNEPENMTETWFEADGGRRPTLADLQRVQGKMAATIHRVAQSQDQVALVTTGSKSLGKYNSDAAGGENLYRDDRLIAAADNDALAVLDFYQAHYYNNEGKQGAWSPFHHSADHWGLDKPIVIGEFYIEDLVLMGDPVLASELCKRLYDLGYAGGWGWQWNQWPDKVAACVRNVP